MSERVGFSAARMRFDRIRAGMGGRRWIDLTALALFTSIAWLYYWRLDRWLINDDEGSYLYAAWRIGLGELPYRDFLTPQLPAFLLPGGWLMAVLGPGVWPARALATALTLAAGLLTWATARRLFGPFVGLVAGAALLLQPDVFLHGRTFRADPFMLALAALGLWLFARAAFPRPGSSSPSFAEAAEAVDPPDRRWLALSGLAFGLATLAKLFGPFVLAGCLAWLLVDGWRRGRPWPAMLLDVLAAGLPCLLTIASGLGGFALLAGPRVVYEAVFEHHTRQGSGTPPLEVLSSGLAFFGAFLRQNNNALLVFVAAAVSLVSWPARDRRGQLFAWQLPTALIFLFLSREKYPRHLMYLMPALATLFALGLRGLLDAARALPGAARSVDPLGALKPDARPTAQPGRILPAALALALLLALLIPWRLLDRDHAFRWETGTEKLADFVSLLSQPDDIVLSDYSELNFYAGRPSTYSGASLSAGAAGSGQITWARLAEELDGRLPPLVLLDGDTEYAHLSFLTDRPALDAWLDEHYGPPAGILRRDYQSYRVFAPKDRPLPVQARFSEGPTLLAAAPDSSQATSGQVLELRSAWRAPDRSDGATFPITDDLGLTLRLLDARGREWAQGDAGLQASDGSDRLRLRPTSRWRAGELSSQRLAIRLPLGLPPGPYDLVLGLYRRGDLSGLDAFGAAGNPLGQAVLVGQIQVEPWRAKAEDLSAEALALDLRADAPGAAGLRLLGRGPLPSESTAAGDLASFDLWWSAEGEAPGLLGTADEVVEPLALRLTLSEPATGAVAADRLATAGAPGFGWRSGPYLMRERIDLPIEPEAGSGSYVLGAILSQPDGAPLPGALPIDLGRIEIRARDLSGHDFDSPDLASDLTRSARVDDLVELLGLARAPSLVEGVATIDLRWRALAPSPLPWRLTVQLLSPGETPSVLTQHDGDPDEGRRPSTHWIRGELIRDLHRLTLPEDLPPGRYPLVAAFYHPLTGTRLPTTGPDALPGDLLRIGELELPPASPPEAVTAP